MFRHFGPATDPEAVCMTVWACVQLPDGLDDWAKLVPWAEKALATSPKNVARLTALGAVLYRAGRFDEAARRLTEAANAVPKGQAAAPTYLFLSMTHQRLGHAGTAREWFDRAVRAIETPTEKVLWHQRLTLRLLRAEAEALLDITRPPEK
jgi:Tfp pilus assembly protein PilF